MLIRKGKDYLNIIVLWLIVIVVFLTVYVASRTTSIPKAVEVIEPPENNTDQPRFSTVTTDLNSDGVVDEKDEALYSHE